MRPGYDRRCESRTRLSQAGAATMVLLLCAACASPETGETTDARPRSDPPAPAPDVAESAIPPTLEPDPLWSAPFSSQPKATEHGFVGPVMPEGDSSALLFLSTDGDGATRWSTPRNPSCTAFAATHADGRELVVLMDSNAAPARGLLATRTTAAAYDPGTGTLVWGPVEVPGTMVGPGLVFGAVPHTVVSVESGPQVALSAATGEVAADEAEGERILHEYDGALLLRRDGRLRALDTTTARELWNSGDLSAPESVAGGPGDVSVEYGPRPQTGDSGAILLRWSASSGSGNERHAYTVNSLRTGERLAVLSAEQEPRIIGASDGGTAVVTGAPANGTAQGQSGQRTVFGISENRLLWTLPPDDDAPRPTRIVAGVLYLSAADTTYAVDMRTGEELASGTWSAPVAALPDGPALLPVESARQGEAFVAMPTAR